MSDKKKSLSNLTNGLVAFIRKLEGRLNSHYPIGSGHIIGPYYSYHSYQSSEDLSATPAESTPSIDLKFAKKELSKKILGLSGLALLASLGTTGCKTVSYQGISVICSPFESYPSSHPCYTEPSRSSGSSSSSSGSSFPKDNYKDGGNHDGGSKGGHYEGC